MKFSVCVLCQKKTPSIGGSPPEFWYKHPKLGTLCSTCKVKVNIAGETTVALAARILRQHK